MSVGSVPNHSQRPHLRPQRSRCDLCCAADGAVAAGGGAVVANLLGGGGSTARGATAPVLPGGPTHLPRHRCAAANGGIIPTNVGLDGTLGACNARWWGGTYGWGFSIDATEMTCEWARASRRSW